MEIQNQKEKRKILPDLGGYFRLFRVKDWDIIWIYEEQKILALRHPNLVGYLKVKDKNLLEIGSALDFFGIIGEEWDLLEELAFILKIKLQNVYSLNPAEVEVIYGGATQTFKKYIKERKDGDAGEKSRQKRGGEKEGSSSREKGTSFGEKGSGKGSFAGGNFQERGYKRKKGRGDSQETKE